jgi:hypothetical protein
LERLICCRAVAGNGGGLAEATEFGKTSLDQTPEVEWVEGVAGSGGRTKASKAITAHPLTERFKGGRLKD